MAPMQGDLAILVISCDRYADLWPVFYHLLRKRWSDCSYPIFHGSNQVGSQELGVTNLLIGEDRSWAESARRMLERVPVPHVLVLLEDFFLRRQVRTDDIRKCHEALVKLDGHYLRLRPFPRPDRPVVSHPFLGEIEPGASYRTALQAAIWRRETLIRLLKDGESAWQMETRGSERSAAIPTGFYSTWRPVLHYTAGVTFGKWLPHVLHMCRREGAPLDLSRRSVMTRAEHLQWAWNVAKSSMANRIPWKPRRKLGNALRALGLIPPRSLD